MSWTMSWCPAFCKLAAMPLPIMPSPMNPTFMCSSAQCHCERREAISRRLCLTDRDCFVASLLAMTARLSFAVAQFVVDPAVPGEPALQLAVRVGLADRVDLGDVGRIAGEFEDHPVGRLRVNRFAVAVIGLAEFFACRVEPGLQLLISLIADLERDVKVAADLGRLLGLSQLVHFRIGELEERQRAAIGKPEKRVAEID